MNNSQNVSKLCQHGLFSFIYGDTNVGLDLVQNGTWENELLTQTIELLPQIGHKPPVVLETNSNIGAHAIPLSKHAIVMAYEPQRLIYQLLVSNSAQNNPSNLYTVQEILGDVNGFIDLPEVDASKRRDFNNFDLFSIKIDHNQETHRVKITKLDNLPLRNLSVLKINRNELYTLKGGLETLKLFSPVLILQNYDPSVELWELLNTGYKLYTFRDGRHLFCCPNNASDTLKAYFNDNFLVVDAFGDKVVPSKTKEKTTVAINAIIDLSKEYQQSENLSKSFDIMGFATTLDPENWHANLEHSKLYSLAQNHAFASTYAKFALDQAPNEPAVWEQYGFARGCNLDFTRAIEYTKKVVKQDPTNYQAQFNLGYFKLQNNDTLGFIDYEKRFHLPRIRNRIKRYSKPIWTYKDDLAGKTLFVICEQGHGDILNFIRYMPQLKALHPENPPTIIFECPESLYPLLKNCRGIDSLFSLKHKHKSLTTEPVEPEKYDLVLSLVSIPFLLEFPYCFNVNNKHLWNYEMPYVFPERTIDFEPESNILNVGIVWAGGADTPHDCNRSVHPTYFRKFEMGGVQLYSLQQDPGIRKWPYGPVDLRAKSNRFIDLSSKLTDFNVTAQIIEKLDLVITVDTAVAHLAGALNKPVWVIIPELFDWRWGGWACPDDDLNKTYWYPSMKLYRDYDSKSPIWNMTGDLKKLVQDLTGV